MGIHSSYFFSRICRVGFGMGDTEGCSTLHFRRHSDDGKPGLDFPTAVAAIFILVIAGTLAGLRPAIYAAELNPIEALKEEN